MLNALGCQNKISEKVQVGKDQEKVQSEKRFPHHSN